MKTGRRELGVAAAGQIGAGVSPSLQLCPSDGSRAVPCRVRRRHVPAAGAPAGRGNGPPVGQSEQIQRQQ